MSFERQSVQCNYGVCDCQSRAATIDCDILTIKCVRPDRTWSIAQRVKEVRVDSTSGLRLLVMTGSFVVFKTNGQLLYKKGCLPTLLHLSATLVSSHVRVAAFSIHVTQGTIPRHLHMASRTTHLLSMGLDREMCRYLTDQDMLKVLSAYGPIPSLSFQARFYTTMRSEVLALAGVLKLKGPLDVIPPRCHTVLGTTDMSTHSLFTRACVKTTDLWIKYPGRPFLITRDTAIANINDYETETTSVACECTCTCQSQVMAVQTRQLELACRDINRQWVVPDHVTMVIVEVVGITSQFSLVGKATSVMIRCDATRFSEFDPVVVLSGTSFTSLTHLRVIGHLRILEPIDTKVIFITGTVTSPGHVEAIKYSGYIFYGPCLVPRRERLILQGYRYLSSTYTGSEDESTDEMSDQYRYDPVPEAIAGLTPVMDDWDILIILDHSGTVNVSKYSGQVTVYTQSRFLRVEGMNRPVTVEMA